jgi:hypothetical protein
MLIQLRPQTAVGNADTVRCGSGLGRWQRRCLKLRECLYDGRLDAISQDMHPGYGCLVLTGRGEVSFKGFSR